jgi:peptidase E
VGLTVSIFRKLPHYCISWRVYFQKQEANGNAVKYYTVQRKEHSTYNKMDKQTVLVTSKVETG